jgi:inosine/guanosine/xanthosine phosphorylase family protein
MSRDAVARAAAAIERKLKRPFPKIALVLGSGLGAFADSLGDAIAIPYRDIPGFPVSSVQGHAGRLVVGDCSGAPIACMQGRLHLYEGHAPADLALPVRTLKRLGAEILVLTNAAGGLTPELGPGALMIVEDHINFTGRNPLAGPNDETAGPRFVDMTEAYDRALREELATAAADVGVAAGSGVYLQTLGPNFETPAEIRAFARLGAHAVGMSTVPETLVARHCGLRVAALSVITNHAAGIADHALSHAETLAEAAKAYDRVSRLLTRFFARISS